MRVAKIIICIIFLFPLLLEASAYLPIFKADFWIERLNNPDEVILSSEEIAELNSLILGENNEMADVIKMETSVSKEELEKWLLEDPLPVDKNMFDKMGKPVKNAFYEELLDNMNFEAINESNELTFGVVTKRTDIRSFPTDEPVFKGPSAKDFDAFQYSAIYPPHVVALMHKSGDGQWGFFQTSFVRGWIKFNNIVFANNKDDLIINNERFVIITGNRVTIFSDNKGAKILESVPMGTSFALSNEDKRYWVIKFPKRKDNVQLQWVDAFIKKGSDVNIGYLPYTKKNVIRQAFKIIGEKYSWGGKNGLRDCSSFIKDVFATMGINLPRNSGHQSNVGLLLAGFDELSVNGDVEKAINSATPGITLLALNGHIMLYLGNVNGNYYALHQLFGYYDKDGFRTVNKAVVTNLELGKDSKMGALKDRIKSINLIVLDRIN